MILWRKPLGAVQESLRHCKQSRSGVVNASLSARLRRERKADEKTDRFNRMLDLCAAAEDLHGAERIFQRLVKDKEAPNHLSFALLVAASAEVRDIMRAEMWLQRFTRAKLDPAIQQHPKVVQSLLAAGAGNMVEGEAHELQSSSLRFSSLIAALKGRAGRASRIDDGKFREIEEAFQEALSGSQSNVTKHLYQEFLSFLACSGRTDQIQPRLQEMKISGVLPDAVTYGIIINALAIKRHNKDFATSFFRQAEQEAIQPTLPLFNSMLKASATAADLEAAKALFEKIYGASLKPNSISFNNLLSACAMAGSASEARVVLEKMANAGVAPDGFSYLWMIKATSRQGGEAAEKVLEEARQRGVGVDTGMYNAVFRAYLGENHEKPQEVKRLFAEMQEAKVQPNAMSYLALANAYAMQNEVERAEDFIFQARQEGGDRHRPEFYACLLLAYARKRGSRSIKAERTFRELVAADVRPSSQMVRYLRMAMEPEQADALLVDLGLEHLHKEDVTKTDSFQHFTVLTLFESHVGLHHCHLCHYGIRSQQPLGRDEQRLLLRGISILLLSSISLRPGGLSIGLSRALLPPPWRLWQPGSVESLPFESLRQAADIVLCARG